MKEQIQEFPVLLQLLTGEESPRIRDNFPLHQFRRTAQENIFLVASNKRNRKAKGAKRREVIAALKNRDWSKTKNQVRVS